MVPFIIAPKGAVIWLPIEWPRDIEPQSILKSSLLGMGAERSDANIAASESGTAKLGRLNMMMIGIFCPISLT